MKEILFYVTDDGEEFDIKEEALYHEKKIKINKELIKFFEKHNILDHDYNDVLSVIIDNFEEFSKIIKNNS